MPIRVKCEKCKKTLSVKDHLAGKKIKCPVCQTVVTVPASTGAPVAKPANPAAVKNPTAASKPAADKTKSNGSPKSNGTPAPPAEFELPSENVEAEALAAFQDEPPPPVVDDTAPKTIDFKCSWCDEDVQLPIEMGGKQAPCPNPECRRIIKVPMPKVAEKKDWRKMDRKGPAAAILNQPEALENAWGTEEATRARQTSLAQAGAIEQPVKPPIGKLGWAWRGVKTFVALALLAVVIFGGVKLWDVNKQHSSLNDAKRLVLDKDSKLKPSLLAAEGHRTIALLYLREGKAFKAKDHFQGSISLVTVDNPDNKNPALNEQLFLIDVALAQIELGGDGVDILNKSKLEWKDLREPLDSTLQRIKSPEAKVLAMREVGSRLFEKKQAELAVGLAASLSNLDGPKLPTARQQIAMVYAMPDQEEKQQKTVKDLLNAADLKDGNARVGYAEGFARKGNFENALAIAKRPGPNRDKLEAYLGVAAVAWQFKNKEEAAKFVKEALNLTKEMKESAAPWHLLHLIRLAARTEDAETVKDVAKNLPPPFKLRAQLEIFLAVCEKSTGDVSLDALQELEAADKEGTTLAIAWNALARQNGKTRDQNRRMFEDRMSTVSAPNEIIDKIRPMVDLGSYLGAMK